METAVAVSQDPKEVYEDALDMTISVDETERPTGYRVATNFVCPRCGKHPVAEFGLDRRPTDSYVRCTDGCIEDGVYRAFFFIATLRERAKAEAQQEADKNRAEQLAEAGRKVDGAKARLAAKMGQGGRAAQLKYPTVAAFHVQWAIEDDSRQLAANYGVTVVREDGAKTKLDAAEKRRVAKLRAYLRRAKDYPWDEASEVTAVLQAKQIRLLVEEDYDDGADGHLDKTVRI